MAYSSGFLAMFLVVLLALANTNQGSYDHHPDDHVQGNYFQDNFLGRAFGFKTSLKQSDASSSPKILRVDNFGAKGNGTDGTQAFARAWDEACSSKGSVSLVVPGNTTYLLEPITFKGPCKADRIRVQIHGVVRAHGDMSGYADDNQRRWIVFDGVQHLTVEGGGTINGWGSAWWNRSCKVHKTQPCPRAPTGMTFHKCEDLVVRNVRSLNPQGVHMSLHSCNNVTVSGVTITAPGNSPNTDGINVRETTNLVISDSVIGTGDDCIALNHGTRHVRISGITCGPGHGISIGSLGKQNSEEHVSDVVVDGATLSGTTNGVRIKTWQGGSGSASGIKFMNIRMENVQNPILIDQFYFCEKHNCPTQNSTVQVEDVLYRNITGTTASPLAVNFDCSDASKCRGIVLQDVDLRHPDNVRASCRNIHLTQIGPVSPLCPNTPDVTTTNNTNAVTSPLPSPMANPSPSPLPPPSVNPSPSPLPSPSANPSPSPLPPPRQNVINVDAFGAKGNGKDDDTDAFKNAWKEACSSNNQEETLLLVPHNTYLLKPIRFNGPCKSKITIQILGRIQASERRLDYPDRHWLWFDRVNDLLLKGGGTIDGNGQVWWRDTCKWNKSRPCTEAPTALSFQGCQNLEVKDLTIKNSQQIQLLFVKCVGVKAHNLTVTAPGNSPNTDGIHITHSQNVDISKCNIATGDDCISIVSGSTHISASDIRCGPGHGISIGSLGGGNAEAHVSDVTVTRAKFFGSTNGVRIKTWQGGSGNVSDVRFTDLEMHNVRNPIIIDQNYCIDKACHQEESAVQVKNVVYQNIRGTVDREAAIILDCSDKHRCEGIVLQDIDLRTQQNGQNTHALCNNVDFLDVRNVSPACPSL